ncbi:ABC transporter ATP-binding protein [Phenylobacterium sp.]|jgi:peptide/nickel transport system ATP-binding protein|uniref:ABC transporter ATP-binding protein n=1 Tax=Phenylobacterium sp. TaxID=1871053 RepID=UPI002E2F612F|nr:ABC transporter ATP-binding protein [Phenylobacterium sp.]HEX3367445.1 ABC transporter ATP-binding protein [Phenylobacterium sp.]
MSRALLEVKGLRLETNPRRGPCRTVLQDLSFTVGAGEFVALVGESGSGKTLAARAILDLLPSGVRRTGGSIRLADRDLAQLDARGLRAVRGSEVGMVFQEPMVSLNPAMTVGRQLAEGLQLHRGLDAAAVRGLCLQMLARVQIRDPEACLRAYPHEFSGGMRQRIMLASVLLLKPKLLIADEPTTALDTLSQREVLDLMVELAREDQVATLMITHDLGLVARYAQRIVVLQAGRLVETGETRQVLSAPAEPYTRQLLAARPRAAPRAAAPALDRGPMLLAAEKVSVAYLGRPTLWGRAAPQPVVRDVDLSLSAGEILALVGASGSGKSTLGRAVLGLRPLASGAVRFEGEDIAGLDVAGLRRFRAAAQLVFQDPFSSLDPRQRVGEVVAAPLRHLPGLGPQARRERVAAVLRDVGLEGFADRLPHQMSGGQRQRVAIARAVISRPRLVVADEPVSALDMTIQAQVLDLLRTLQADYGFACLFITHDLSVVAQLADRMAVMEAGRIVESGFTSAVLAAPQHAYTRALLAATPRLPGEPALSAAGA